MKNSKPKPPLEKITAAYKSALAQNPAFSSFVVDGTEYRSATMPDAPALAWGIIASSAGDVVVDKRDGGDLVRPDQTMNGGYLMVSIARKVPLADAYFRRRAHEWIAHAFLGPPPSLASIVEHLDDDGTNNAAWNLVWSDCAKNRARRNGTAKFTPEGKVRQLPLDLRLIRRVQVRTGHKGQRLAKYIEKLIRKDLVKKNAA
jgi:hypothetical protein